MIAATRPSKLDSRMSSQPTTSVVINLPDRLVDGVMQFLATLNPHSLPYPESSSTTAPRPPAVKPLPRTTQEPTITVQPQTFLSFYEEFCSKAFLKSSAPHRREMLAAIRNFQEYLGARSIDPRAQIQAVSNSPEILTEYMVFLRNKTRGGSVQRVGRALDMIHSLMSLARERNLVTTIPDKIRREAIRSEGTPPTRFSDEVQGLFVSLEEYKQLRSVSLNFKGSFTSVSKLRPCDVMPLVLDFSAYAGARTNDAFPFDKIQTRPGLLWEKLLTETACPLLPDLHCCAGWLWMMVHKTQHHDVSHNRNPSVLIPLSTQLRRRSNDCGDFMRQK
ncbi:MAG: hypothetical protein IPL86_19205 [Flavobacteriales bacterium]|nr:hypothetical protein [Flavobacteriales bacterium]